MRPQHAMPRFNPTNQPIVNQIASCLADRPGISLAKYTIFRAHFIPLEVHSSMFHILRQQM